MQCLMIPTNGRRIEMIKIYYEDKIYGFKFLDENQNLKFEIGHCKEGSVTEVLIQPNEQIIGCSAKRW